jgi:hypothetical protein
MTGLPPGAPTVLDQIAAATHASEGTCASPLPCDGRPAGSAEAELARLAPLVGEWRKQVIDALNAHAAWLESADCRRHQVALHVSDAWRGDGPSVFRRLATALSASSEDPEGTRAEIAAAARSSGAAAPKIEPNYVRLIDAERSLAAADPVAAAKALATPDAAVILRAAWSAALAAKS